MTDPGQTHTPENQAHAGLFRRLFAILYDCFLLIAIFISISAIVTSLNQGKAIESSDTFSPVFFIIIFSLSYLYFAWFWINGGQTLGMKTWRIQLHTAGNIIDWKTAAIRYFAALLSWGVGGLGFLWAFFDKKNRCWHDLISKTVLLDLREK